MGAEADISIAGAPPGTGAPDRGLDLDLGGKGLSFQSRIAVVALITAVAVLMAACVLFMLQQWRTERTLFIQNQAHVAAVAASEAAHALVQHDSGDLDVSVQALKADPRIRSVQFLDAHGRTIVSDLRTGEGPAPTDLVQVEAPITAGGTRLGTVVLRSAPEGLSALLPRFISMGGALFFVAAGLALFMGRWLAARLTRPVDRLSRAMHEVSVSGDFGQRVRHGENDEFGRLTDSFNGLLAQLEKNDHALRSTLEALVEARDAAEAANVLKSQFLANMSHEIRTPLNGVLAMAQIMAMGEMSPTQRDRLGVIRQSGEALLTVLNDILDLSKIEAGRMEIDDADFDTAELCRNLEAAHAPVAARKGLSFSVDVSDSALGVRRGDAARLQQVLNNLISNAVKFTQSGEVRVTIDGEGEGGAQGLKIAVTDSGIGIPEAKLPLLFQKFMQVDSSTTRQFGGTGLGLAICRELAQLMGGDVWAESVQGVGSTFFVRVPLARTSVPADGAGGGDPARNGGTDAGKLRILAAEDNPTNRLVLKTIMSTFGLDVEIVDDGHAAVEAWATGAYDLILMDIQMPGMDGITATKVIRSTEARTGRARTPIVALSANAMTHQVREYLQAGMDLHVAKPIQLSKLQEALETVMNRQAERASAGETAMAVQSA